MKRPPPIIKILSVTGYHHQHINILPLCVETESQGDGEVEATSHYKILSVTGCHHQHINILPYLTSHINILPLCVETESEGDGDEEAASHCKDSLSD